MTASNGVRLDLLPLALMLICLGPRAQASGAIYRCVADGVTTYSDRPCSGQAELHELDLDAMNTYQAPQVTAAARAPVSRAKRTARAEPDRNATRREMCARTARSLKEIANTMRSGYRAKEGERLRARQSKLRDQQREARCR